jgi:hypothetical protein
MPPTSTPTVWARDRCEDDQRLIKYHRGRTVWLLETDRAPDSLTACGTR